MTGPQAEEREDLWGYRKRLSFVRESVREAFPARAPKEMRVLDVGCGNGSQLALPLARGGFHLKGVDTDARSIEHARRLAEGMTNLELACARVEELPLSELYEVVILSEVLEHLAEPEKLLSESARRMAAGGIMIVTVPNGYGEFEIDSWVFRKLRLQRVVDAFANSSRDVLGSTDNTESGHIQFFTRRRLHRLFDACGLAPFRQGGASFLAGPIAGHALARFESFIEWNARVTDRLPLVLASGWYFALRRKTTKSDEAEAARL
ncbi:MAG TPA: methyltransferase domain-containing protein [Pyrinomonadaceae bacterium]|nr:methyltransferase domain-containing protein [Pyrinomonadaceae bacterium]